MITTILLRLKYEEKDAAKLETTSPIFGLGLSFLISNLGRRNL